MKYPHRILNISFYGAPVQGAKQFSGALERQKNYAKHVERFVMVVPDTEGNYEVRTEITDNFSHIALPSKGHVAFFINALKRARELHKEEQFTLITVDNPHIAGLLGLILKKTFGALLLVHSMADMPFNKWYVRERWSNHLKNAVSKFVLKHTDFVRVSTQHEVTRLKKKGVAEQKILHMHFYIDAEQFKEHLESASVEHERNGKSVLYLGRLGVQKDLSTLIYAWSIVSREVKDASLIIAGGGPEEGVLKKLSRNLQVEKSVIFTGAVPYDEAASYYKNTDLFVTSSLYEGTCMVLHEAGLAKLPIVSTAHAGALDFIRNGEEGYTVGVRDHNALAERMIEILQDTEKAQKMGECAYERVKDFSEEKSLQKWEAFCKKTSQNY